MNAIRELTDFDLGVGGFLAMLGSKTLEVGESVERVNSLKVEGIDSAVWRDKDKAESRILFRVRCSAAVVTSISSTLPFLSPTRYAVGGEKQQLSPFLSPLLAPLGPSRQERERTLPVTLYGEAKFARTDGDWRLSGVRVDQAQLSSEEMAALSLVSQRKER